MGVNKVKIKYRRRNRTGKLLDEFWSEREVGQIIREDAFEGLIDEVLEIKVVVKDSQGDPAGLEYTAL